MIHIYTRYYNTGSQFIYIQSVHNFMEILIWSFYESIQPLVPLQISVWI